MDIQATINKYYKSGTKLYDIYMSHANDVTEKALHIVRKHRDLAVDVRFIEEAAMLHDIGIFKTHAPHIACEGNFPYICHGYLGHELLTSEGFPKHGLVCERHTGTGLRLEEIISRQLPVPRRDMRPQSLEEKIVCFADKFYSKAQLGREKSVKKIREGLGKHGKYQVEMFDEWCDLFL
ncbi:MAG: HD domain-containing protein [Dysgonamonadaceae bacterium]|jgi:uncharacterized protein|nr:HD domain-containing protein [Dysgonamonadaceae bacterium]